MNFIFILLMLLLSGNAFADSKASAYIVDGSPSNTDMLEEIKDLYGTPLNRLVGIGTIFKSNNITVTGTNVGVASTAPGTILDVQGTARTTALQLSTNPGSGYVLVGNSVGIGTWMPATTLPGTGGSGLWATQNTTDQSLAGGNVGIGTTATTTSALTVMNGNVGVGTWKPKGPLDIIASGTALRISSPDSAQIILDGVSGGSARDIYWQSSGSLRWILRQDGDTESGSNSGSSLKFIRRADNGSDLGTTLEMDRANGNIKVTNRLGVGTALPGSKLSVVGGVGIGVNVSSNYVLNAAPTSGMMIEGNVGIGSTAPQSKLTVVGTGTTSSANAFMVRDSSFNPKFVVDNAGNVGIGTTETNSAAVTIMNGNIGIGTWKPAQDLEVIGTVKATSFIGDGSALTGLSAGGWTLGVSNIGVSTTNNVGIGTNLNTTAALSVMNGNVGIGTWKPKGNIDIISSATALRISSPTSAQIELDGAAGGTARDIYWESGGALRWILRNDGDTETGSGNAGSTLKFIRRADNGSDLGTIIELVRSNGALKVTNNLGIGTVLPGSKLSVAGGVGIGANVSSNYVIGAAPTSGLMVEGNVGIGSTVAPNALYVVGTPMFTTGLNIGIGTASATRLCIANNAITPCP